MADLRNSIVAYIFEAQTAQKGRVLMGLNVSINYNLQRYLQDPRSSEARAFFEGARSMMTAFQLAPASDYPNMLSANDQRHLTALLIQGDQQQRERQRKDAQSILKLYDVDKMSFLAFVFDLSAINMFGQAIDDNGNALEDSMFRILPGRVRQPWLDCNFTHYQNDQEITHADYQALSEQEKQDYWCNRYYWLKLNGRPALRISDSDHYLIEELIRRFIPTNDLGVNLRFLMEIYYSEETGTYGKLYRYRDAILEAFEEPCESDTDCVAYCTIGPMVVKQARQGHLQTAGHLLICQLQQLSRVIKPNDLLKISPYDVGIWTKVIECCLRRNDYELEHFVTDEDIASYRDVNGRPLPGAVQETFPDAGWKMVPYREEETGSHMQKDFFKHILVEERLCPHLIEMLNRILDCDDLITTGPNRGIVSTLRSLMHCLSKSDEE